MMQTEKRELLTKLASRQQCNPYHLRRTSSLRSTETGEPTPLEAEHW